MTDATPDRAVSHSITKKYAAHDCFLEAAQRSDRQEARSDLRPVHYRSLGRLWNIEVEPESAGRSPACGRHWYISDISRDIASRAGFQRYGTAIAIFMKR